MGKYLFRLFNSIHAFLYRRTRGRLGGKVQGLHILLLSTIGRRSGKVRVTPLGYFNHEGSYIVIASNAGFDRHPGWFHNLRSRPDVMVEVGDSVVAAEANVVGAGERERLWARLIVMSPGYSAYARRTKRLIPIVALTPHPSPAKRERGRG